MNILRIFQKHSLEFIVEIATTGGNLLKILYMISFVKKNCT